MALPKLPMQSIRYLVICVGGILGFMLLAVFPSYRVIVGTEAKIEINRNKFTTNPPDFIRNPPDPKLAEKWEGDGWVAKGHVENWFDCIRSREKPHADVEIGHRTASLCHLITITRELGRRLKWDPDSETFPGDDEANSFLDRPRHKGWELRKV